MDGRQAPLTSVEDLAVYFVKDIRVVQPEGPSFISGYCLRGIVAFETALQLHAQGQETAMLSLFGSLSPTSISFPHRTLVTAQQQIQKIARHAMTFWQLRLQAGMRYLRDKARQQKEEQKKYYRNNPHCAQVEDATIIAVHQYKPRIYPGQVHLFLSSEHPVNLRTDRLLDWRKFAAGGIEIQAGPSVCDGDTMLLEPHAKVFADLLRGCLSRF